MSVASMSAGFLACPHPSLPAGREEYQIGIGFVPRLRPRFQCRLDRLDGLRPEWAASRNPRLGPRVIAPAAFQVQVLDAEVRHIGIAETAVDAQQDHGFQGHRRRCQHGPDLGRLEHALPILLPFTAQLAPARADEPRPKPDGLVDQVGLVGVPENATDPLDLHLAGQLAVGLGDLGTQCLEVIGRQVIHAVVPAEDREHTLTGLVLVAESPQGQLAGINPRLLGSEESR